jgi:hypothetical protein
VVNHEQCCSKNKGAIEVVKEDAAAEVHKELRRPARAVEQGNGNNSRRRYKRRPHGWCILSFGKIKCGDNFIGFEDKLFGKDGMRRCATNKRSEMPEPAPETVAREYFVLLSATGWVKMNSKIFERSRYECRHNISLLLSKRVHFSFFLFTLSQKPSTRDGCRDNREAKENRKQSKRRCARRNASSRRNRGSANRGCS